MAAAKISLYVLNSGMVLDHSVFKSLAANDMAGIVNSVRGEPSSTRLKIIDNADTFFTSKNMLALIRADDKDYKLIAEQAQIIITEDEVRAILLADKVQADITAKMVPPKPPYEFAPVPYDWSIKTNLQVGNGLARASVRRLKLNVQGGGTSYSITLKQLERIWLIASRKWAKITNSTSAINDIRAEGYVKSGHVVDDRVHIGCQVVQRYELEQLALHLNWAFPEPQVNT